MLGTSAGQLSFKLPRKRNLTASFVNDRKIFFGPKLLLQNKILEFKCISFQSSLFGDNNPNATVFNKWLISQAFTIDPIVQLSKDLFWLTTIPFQPLPCCWITLFIFKHLFVYLAVPGLNCSTRDLWSSLQRADSLVVAYLVAACKLLVEACGI